MAGVIKVVLAMQHRMIPPAINIRQLNPKIDWERVPRPRSHRADPLAGSGPRPAAASGRERLRHWRAEHAPGAR